MSDSFHHVFTILCPSTRSDGSAAVVSVSISTANDETEVAIEVLDARIVADPVAARDVLGVAARSDQVLDLYPVIEQQIAPPAPRAHRRTKPAPAAEPPADGGN
jgi:hypothetical protein